MDNLVYTTAVSRLVLISGVFLINFFSLLRLILCGIKKPGRSRHCVHTISSGVTLLCCLVYLCSWIPYLSYSLSNGHWIFLSARDHCQLQYSITSQVTTILLAVQAIRKLFDAFSDSRATVMTYAVVIAWIVPQLCYLGLTEVFSAEQNSFRFLDRLVLIPSSQSGVHQVNGTGVEGATASSSASKYTIGFMICLHQLANPVLTQLFWHYIVLVLPLTVLIFVCFAIQACKSSLAKTVKSKSKNDGRKRVSE